MDYIEWIFHGAELGELQKELDTVCNLMFDQENDTRQHHPVVYTCYKSHATECSECDVIRFLLLVAMIVDSKVIDYIRSVGVKDTVFFDKFCGVVDTAISDFLSGNKPRLLLYPGFPPTASYQDYYYSPVHVVDNLHLCYILEVFE